MRRSPLAERKRVNWQNRSKNSSRSGVHAGTANGPNAAARGHRNGAGVTNGVRASRPVRHMQRLLKPGLPSKVSRRCALAPNGSTGDVQMVKTRSPANASLRIARDAMASKGPRVTGAMIARKAGGGIRASVAMSGKVAVHGPLRQVNHHAVATTSRTPIPRLRNCSR